MNRKRYPIFTGVITYFPDALMEISQASLAGNKQHVPGEPLHWDRTKSTDDIDAMMRHLIDHAKGIKYDDDGVLHLSKAGWRLLAVLQKQIEELNSN